MFISSHLGSAILETPKDMWLTIRQIVICFGTKGNALRRVQDL